LSPDMASFHSFFSLSLADQEVVKDMFENWMVCFCNVFGQEWAFICNWYLRLGKKIIVSANFLPRKALLFGATTHHK
jgi:hypothetical protein